MESNKKPNPPVPYSFDKHGCMRQGNPSYAEWKASVQKLISDWSRLRLSNEDVETILKIASKLP